MPDSSPLAQLQAAAEAVRRQLNLAAYDAQAVQHLAQFIESQRPSIKDAEREGVINALGCFLGQCMVETYKGEWATGPDKSTGVGINGTHFFNPFYRVSQQLNRGLSESVAVFFTGIPALLSSPIQRKNWIK
ncbi:hypothetical protein [Hymenobacter sp. BT491]|uniref:hypothetical protein n=1 Tax=Hymenobacter sp. BT491 TaxID=2766779 RepID=UPI00165391C6|nr:hypothetical protein [Hymenobacter sp. BT491]MBC6988148.1 hypothetical protein [Hymenobacter sp. BT491]